MEKYQNLLYLKLKDIQESSSSETYGNDPAEVCCNLVDKMNFSNTRKI